MPRILRLGRQLVSRAAFLLLLAGCTAPVPEAEPEIEIELPHTERVPVPILHRPIPTTPYPALQPGPAYFISDGRLVGLIDGEWTTLREEDPKLIWLFEGANGRAYARAADGVLALEADRIERIVDVPIDHFLRGAAVGLEGELALLIENRLERPHSQLLHLHRHGLWLSSPSEMHSWLFSNFAEFDRHGQLWTWMSPHLTRRAWPWPTPTLERAEFPLRGGERANFALGPNGDVYMFTNEAGYRVEEDGAVELFRLPGRWPPSEAQINANGTIALSWSSSCAVVRVELGDPVRVEPIDVAMDCIFEGHQIVIDDRDRIWVPTEGGLFVLPPKAAPIHYRSGTVPLLASDVFSLVVVGAGPELPAPGPVRVTTVVGQVTPRDDEPVADVDVSLRSVQSTWPSEYVLHAKTDGGGWFRFPAVPLGDYDVIVGEDVVRGGSTGMGNAMREGFVHDLGQLHPFAAEFVFGEGLVGTVD